MHTHLSGNLIHRFRVEYLHKVFRIFLTRDLSIFPCLFIRSFIYISMNSHIFIFYSLVYKSMLCALLFNFGHWELFLAPMSLGIYPFNVIFCFLALPYTVIIRCFGFILYISSLSPRIRTVPNHCGSSHWHTVREASIWMVVFIAIGIWWLLGTFSL